MTLIAHDPETGPQAAAPVGPRRWRRIGLVAATLAVGLAVATSLVLGGDDTATANTAERTDDGEIVITLREAKHPKDLERRLNELGVPAVVDFLESGFGCDRARSTGWVVEPRDDDPVITHGSTSAEEDPLSHTYVLHPDHLRPGETVALEFQIDEHGDDLAVAVKSTLSTSPVGPCEPVRDGSIVDAEAGIAGG